MLRKAILAVAAASLIGLASTAADAQSKFGGGGGVRMGGAHFGGGGWSGARVGGGHWRGGNWGGGWSGQRWAGHRGHWRGPGWGVGAAALGLGIGLATAPLWAAPYYDDYYAYDPCWERIWWRGAWHLRRVC